MREAALREPRQTPSGCSTPPRQTGTLLWEAFVFPFHQQIARLQDLVAGGAIGELMEIKSNFHFQLSNPGNIRYSRELEGGALNDVGCYPVRLAAEFFGAPHEAAWAGATWGGDGVDVDTWGVLEYPGGRRLHLSCGLGRSYDTYSSLEGTAGRIEVSNPFHPGPADTYQVIAPRAEPRQPPGHGGGGLVHRGRSGTSTRYWPARTSPGCWRSTPPCPPPRPCTTWPRPSPPGLVRPGVAAAKFTRCAG